MQHLISTEAHMRWKFNGIAMLSPSQFCCLNLWLEVVHQENVLEIRMIMHLWKAVEGVLKFEEKIKS
jgi:hypothetical protein